MRAYPATLYFAAQARNNAWANHRLLKACAGLSQEEFEAKRTSFFPSIKATLNHILVIDWFYVDAMEGGTFGHATFANPEPCVTVTDLRREQAEVDNRLIACCEALGDPGHIVEVHRAGRIQRERTDRLLHLFQHDIHHRGQVHAMLAGSSVKPPQLDEFFSEEEAPLRTTDFAELGWTEAAIWPEPR
jgi:uncharacterized damage-inducible protein DinB